MSFTLLGILNSQAAGGGAPSAIEQITYFVATEGQTDNIVFSNIPQTYKHLFVVAVSHSTDAVSSVPEWLLEMNGGGNSGFHGWQAAPNFGVQNNPYYNQPLYIGDYPNDSKPAQQMGNLVLKAMNYTNTSKYSNAVTETFSPNSPSASDRVQKTVNFMMQNAGALTSLEFSDYRNQNLRSNTRYVLYGVLG